MNGDVILVLALHDLSQPRFRLLLVQNIFDRNILAQGLAGRVRADVPLLRQVLLGFAVVHGRAARVFVLGEAMRALFARLENVFG